MARQLPPAPHESGAIIQWARDLVAWLRETRAVAGVGLFGTGTPAGYVIGARPGEEAAEAERGRYEAYIDLDDGDPPEAVLKLSDGRHRVILQDTWVAPGEQEFALPGSDGTYYLVLELTYPDTWEAWALVAAGDLPEQDHTNRVIIQAYVVVADGAFGQPEMLRAPGDIEVVPFREWDICVDGAAKKVMVAASAPYDGA